MINFHNLPARSISSAHLRVDFLTEAGPRLVRLFLADTTDNLLAEVPDIHWPTPFGEFHVFGGHRIALAPEALGLTYIPEDSGVIVEETPCGVKLLGPVQAAAGVSKAIEIELHPDRPALTLRHQVRNEQAVPIEIAPWAVTQLPPGGIALMPLRDLDDGDHHVPDRQLVLWPYTSWQDDRLFADDELVWLEAQPLPGECKVGTLAHGWLGYYRSGVLLLKRFDPQLAQLHPDRNTNAQLYCNNRIVELETLGPLTVLQPGQQATHVEVWEIQRGLDVPPSIEGVSDLIHSLLLK